MNHANFMELALKQAKIAEEIDEVPVGAVVVKDGVVIGKGHNTKETSNLITGHAEINAILDAEKALNDYRLDGCDLYVTLEPCIMCCGAIISAHINKVYYGASDNKSGGINGIDHILDLQGLNHFVKYENGILEDECSKILKNYFARKREKER